jgi:serine/threonine protein phosphatase PrpC
VTGSRIAWQSRAGGRTYNQDRLGHWQTAESTLLVVADGMGGHANGDVAAQLVVEHLGAEFERAARPRIADPDLFLYRRIAGAHALLGRAARARGFDEVPRTTIAACVVQGARAYWLHVGDSRLYHIRADRVIARTKDHTRVQRLLDEGRIGAQDVHVHPERNVLLQCLGGPVPPSVVPATSAALEPGDVLLLCSDGLWGPLTQRQMLHALLTQELQEAMTDLATLAERRAGPQCDNVTALAMRWGEDAIPEAIPAAGPRTVPSHDLPTDVQDFTATDLDFLRMSDEDIDTAIAELKAALRKTPWSR